MSAYVGLSTILHHALADYAAAHPLSGPQWRACRHIQQCRSPALGGTQWHCDTCGTPVEIYHACRDRHCPRCQRRATEEWCAAQRGHLLPVRYHHLVFTLPHTLNAWVRHAPRTVYGALFECAWHTLATFAQDPRRLGGQLGAIAVLHTWTQTLTQHIHLHLLVPGGAVDKAGGWHPSRADYLFPVRALARRFRGRMVSQLRAAYRAGTLGEQDPGEVNARLDAVMAQDWVVYSKPVLTRPATIIDYLGRYTHRIALSDARIEGIAHGTVRLGYTDRQPGHRHRVMELSEAELIARMLKHILPPGFQRVRHYGFLANACRARRLAQIRTALAAPAPTPDPDADAERPDVAPICPSCHHGHLHPSALIAPRRGVDLPAPTPPGEAARERRRPA